MYRLYSKRGCGSLLYSSLITRRMGRSRKIVTTIPWHSNITETDQKFFFFFHFLWNLFLRYDIRTRVVLRRDVFRRNIVLYSQRGKTDEVIFSIPEQLAAASFSKTNYNYFISKNTKGKRIRNVLLVLNSRDLFNINIRENEMRVYHNYRTKSLLYRITSFRKKGNFL